MTGVDTNVLVRLLAADDPAQTRHARRFFTNNEVLIAKTVLLETEWVLRSAYGIPAQNIVFAFRKLNRTAGIRLEDPAGLDRAMDLYERGTDFADALHLVSCRDGADTFATFDTQFRKKTKHGEGLPKLIAP